jgi:hypothetical protein
MTKQVGEYEIVLNFNGWPVGSNSINDFNDIIKGLLKLLKSKLGNNLLPKCLPGGAQ